MPFGDVNVIAGADVLIVNAISLVSDLQLLILSLTQILQLEDGAFGTVQA